MVIQSMRTVLITLKKHTTKVMDLAFKLPKSETEEQEMRKVVDMLASLLYEQLREEMQLLVKKVHITIPNQIRLIQDALTQSDLATPLSEGE